MFSNFRKSLGLALLLALTTAITVFAKGGFSFITVTGLGLKEPVRITDTELTMSFFAFANFFEDKTDTPDNPGAGYEITRFYIDGKREIAFDSLHYYPDTGYVFYDGIVNGDSEYDDEWYTADPQIGSVFENALLAHTQSIAASPNSQTVNVGSQTGSAVYPIQLMTSIAIVASLTLVLALLYRFRKQAVH